VRGGNWLLVEVRGGSWLEVMFACECLAVEVRGGNWFARLYRQGRVVAFCLGLGCWPLPLMPGQFQLSPLVLAR